MKSIKVNQLVGMYRNPFVSLALEVVKIPAMAEGWERAEIGSRILGGKPVPVIVKAGKVENFEGPFQAEYGISGYRVMQYQPGLGLTIMAWMAD